MTDALSASSTLKRVSTRSCAIRSRTRFRRHDQPAAAVDVGQHRFPYFHTGIQAEQLRPPPGQLDFRPDAGHVSHDCCLSLAAGTKSTTL
jgi:hypothetical protein